METLDEKIRAKARAAMEKELAADVQAFNAKWSRNREGDSIMTDLHTTYRGQDGAIKHNTQPEYVSVVMDRVQLAVMDQATKHVEQLAVNAFLADVENLKGQVEQLEQGITSND